MVATKNFRVESFVSGLAIKAPVRVASNAPLALSGELTHNGVPLVAGDRILVKDQVDPVENGIYNVESSAWQRAGDFDGERDIVGGTIVPSYRSSDAMFEHWILNGIGTPQSPGVDALTFTLFYDPAASGSNLPMSTSINNTLRADNAGGWEETDTVRINATGGIFADSGITLGPSDAIFFTYATDILTTIGTGGFIRWDINVRQHFIQPFYMLERAAANFDQVGLGQFWVRNDSPNVPMFTDDTGVDYQLNVAPSFSAPLVLLDNEEIQLGTGTDVVIDFDGASLVIAPAASATPIDIQSAAVLRIRNALGSGYVDIQNVGVLANNDLQITEGAGGISNVTYELGAWDHSDNRFLRPVLDDYAVQHQTLGSVAGTLDIDFEDGNSAFLELTENVTTVNLQNPPVSGRLGQIEIEILQDSVARTIAWPAAVQWPGGTAPDLSTTLSTHLIHLRTRDGGTTYLGTFAEEFS